MIVGVLVLRESEAAVLLRDLHAERAERGEPLDDAQGDLPFAVDRVCVHLFAQEAVELLGESAELRPLLLRRKRRQEVEAECPEEELPQEARPFPTGFARVLGDLSGLVLRDGHAETLLGARRAAESPHVTTSAAASAGSVPPVDPARK